VHRSARRRRHSTLLRETGDTLEEMRRDGNIITFRIRKR
jgi:hypothetical protein